MSCGLNYELNPSNKLTTLNLNIKSSHDIKRDSYLPDTADYESGNLVVNGGSSFKKRVQVMDDFYADDEIFVNKSAHFFDQLLLQDKEGHEAVKISLFNLVDNYPEKSFEGLPGIQQKSSHSFLYQGLSEIKKAEIIFNNTNDNIISKIQFEDDGKMTVENHGDKHIIEQAEIIRTQVEKTLNQEVKLENQKMETTIDVSEKLLQQVKINNVDVMRMDEERIDTQIPLHVQSLFLPKTQNGNFDLVNQNEFITTAVVKNRENWEPVSYYKVLFQTLPSLSITEFSDNETLVQCISDNTIRLSVDSHIYTLEHDSIKQNGTFAMFSIQNEYDLLNDLGYQNHFRIVSKIEDKKITFVILLNDQKIAIHKNILVNCLFSNY